MSQEYICWALYFLAVIFRIQIVPVLLCILGGYKMAGFSRAFWFALFIL